MVVKESICQTGLEPPLGNWPNLHQANDSSSVIILLHVNIICLIFNKHIKGNLINEVFFAEFPQTLGPHKILGLWPEYM